MSGSGDKLNALGWPANIIFVCFSHMLLLAATVAFTVGENVAKVREILQWVWFLLENCGSNTTILSIPL